MKKEENIRGETVAYSGITFFKFATGIIESGLWAKMSATARTLYPVLLRFSDRNFKYVYPGAQCLMQLTGFKSKASLKRARKELVALGLISVQTGVGRRNTRYFFHFETICPPEGYSSIPLAGKNIPLREADARPSARHASGPPERHGYPSEGGESTPLYNKINISINHQVPEQKQNKVSQKKMKSLLDQYGRKKIDLAISECKLAGLETEPNNLQKILKRHQVGSQENAPNIPFSDSQSLQNYLSGKISLTSVQLIDHALIDENNGVLVFQSTLPVYLKSLLERLCSKVIFEPAVIRTVARSKEILN